MFVSKLKEEDLTFELIDRLLFQDLDDTGESADCIIVLGSAKSTKYRVPVAVEAYNAGRSNKIMLCGGAKHEFPDGKYSEAEHMHKSVLALGVSNENIILENSSQNTIENVLFALIELQRTFWLNKLSRVLLVTTTFHMRRSLLIARYLFPKHIAVLPCPANDSNTKRDNWMNTSIGIERAKNEAISIIRCVVNGVIPDFEI